MSGIYEQAGTPCRYSVFVLCGERDKCKTCGWSPAVKRKRVEAIRQRRAAELSGEREPEKAKVPEKLPRKKYLPRKKDSAGTRKRRSPRSDEEIMEIIRTQHRDGGGDLVMTEIAEEYGVCTRRLRKLRERLEEEN